MVDPKIAYTSTFLNLTRLAVSLAYMNVVVCPILFIVERKRKISKNNTLLSICSKLKSFDVHLRRILF